MTRSQENPKAWAYFEKHAQYIADKCYYIMFEGQEFFEDCPSKLCEKLFFAWTKNEEGKEWRKLISNHISPRK